VFGRSVTAAVISEDLRTVLVADAEGQVIAWDGEEGRLAAVLGDRDGPVYSLEITSDGEHGYLVRAGRQVEYWSLRPARRLSMLKGPYDSATESPAGHRVLISAADSGRLVIWDRPRGAILHPSPPIRFLPWCLAFSPDGRFMALRNRFDSPDYSVSLIDIDHLLVLPRRIISPVAVTALAFDPSGRTLAGGCADQCVRLWDIASGGTLLTLEGHSASVSLVEFFPDGETLATGAVRPDGAMEIFLWRAGEDRTISTADAEVRPASRH
jgi:WD40 repeat protein